MVLVFGALGRKLDLGVIANTPLELTTRESCDALFYDTSSLA